MSGTMGLKSWGENLCNVQHLEIQVVGQMLRNLNEGHVTPVIS